MPKPDNFLKEMREAAAKKALPPVDVKSGPEAERWPGSDFTTAQASDPEGGQTVEEAAAGHAEKVDTAEDRFWALVYKGSDELTAGPHRKHAGEGDVPYVRNLGEMYEFLSPEYQALYDRADAGRAPMEQARAAREEFEEEFPPESGE